MRILAWYSAIMLSATLGLGAYGFFITHETPLSAILALLILYFPPAVYIWLTIFKKR
ncbi:MAG: hypothetical protein HQ558_04565 [Candidatus Omnitrophica bacterium]|nr:hypothetical protein [Candidatus Omnitrophota bacterium]